MRSDWSSDVCSSDLLPSFLVVLISSLAPISLLQFEISYQPTQPLNLLVPFFMLVMPRGTRYCSECLIRPFSKARLFLRPFVLLVLTSFLSLLPPSGSPRGPRGSALGMASRICFRHFSFYSGPYQNIALQEIPTNGANYAPPQLDSWAQPNLGSI